jgi:hypothetical protein
MTLRNSQRILHTKFSHFILSSCQHRSAAQCAPPNATRTHVYCYTKQDDTWSQHVFKVNPVAYQRDEPCYKGMEMPLIRSSQQTKTQDEAVRFGQISSRNGNCMSTIIFSETNYVRPELDTQIPIHCVYIYNIYTVYCIWNCDTYSGLWRYFHPWVKHNNSHTVIDYWQAGRSSNMSLVHETCFFDVHLGISAKCFWSQCQYRVAVSKSQDITSWTLGDLGTTCFGQDSGQHIHIWPKKMKQ